MPVCLVDESFNSQSDSGERWYNFSPCAECKNENVSASFQLPGVFSFQPGRMIIFVTLCVWCSYLNLTFSFPEKFIFTAGWVFAEFPQTFCELCEVRFFSVQL